MKEIIGMMRSKGQRSSKRKSVFTTFLTVFSAICMIACVLIFPAAFARPLQSTNVPANSNNDILKNLDTRELKMNMLVHVASTIFSDAHLANDVKTDIAKLAVAPLRTSPEIRIAGTDKATRPVAVSFQNAFEQTILTMIDEGQVSHVTAIIHTRKPTTPLCNPVGEALPQTMHSDMQSDPKRYKTIQDRTITLREMARKGESLDLYVAYLKDGLQNRSAEEQRIYRREITTPENSSLHDTPLTCSTMPNDIVGASYILKTRRGNTLYFSINSTQAIDAGGNTLWRYWFGDFEDTSVNERYQEVMKYLQNCSMKISL